MYLRASVLLTLLVSASICQVFYFSKTVDVFRRTENCQICYIDHCLSMETSRCDYYYQADEMIRKHEDMAKPDFIKANHANEKIRADVDAALFDLVESASEATECIPDISRYTDCTKENICLGCTNCDCNGEGKWNCTEIQVCRPENTLNVDHRMLVMVIENLMSKDYPQQEHKGFKTKRSVTDDYMNSITNANGITFDELSEWWYGDKPLSQEHEQTTTTKLNQNIIEDEAKTVKVTTTESGPNKTTTEISTQPDTENLAFDEVLRSIGIDARTHVRRKLPMDISQNDTIYDVDYIIFDKDGKATHNHNITSYVPDILSFVDQIDDRMEEDQKESKVVVDLLESAKKNNMNIKNTTDYAKIYKYNINTNPLFENTNDIVEYDALNIMKRDVATVNSTDTINATIQTPIKISNRSNNENKCKMSGNVVSSLNELITSMHKELEDLQNIKGDLVNFLKSNTNFISNEFNNANKHYFKDNLHNIDIDPRRINQSYLVKTMDRLKRDIYEVLKDIILIHKYKGTSDLPDDLKFLINALKRYVSTTDIKVFKADNIKLENNRNIRQNWPTVQHDASAKEQLIKIINIIDTQMPRSNALDTLSLATKKIMYRVIKKYYIDDFFAIGFKTHKYSYNITKDLQSVANRWQQFVLSSQLSTQLQKTYTLKLLHFVLTEDINKMEDVQALINFAHSRRVLPIFKHMEENIVERIAKDLTAINDKVKLLLNIHKRLAQKSIAPVSNNIIKHDNIIKTVTEKGQRKRKNSFFKKIRNLLRGSKQNVVDLLNRGIPKAEIRKKIVRNKMNELSQKRYDEYEETMRRWQRNLDINSRRKRSMLDTNGFRARIKNIIPKYLRGKVNGKIDNKKKKTDITRANKTTKQKPKAKSGNYNVGKSYIDDQRYQI